MGVLSDVTGPPSTAQKWYIRGNKIIPIISTSECLILSSSTPTGTYYTDGRAYYYFNLNVNTIGYMEFENWSFTKSDKKGVLFVKNNSGEFKTTFAKTYNIDKETIEFSELGYSIKTYHFDNSPNPTLVWSSDKSSVASFDDTGKLILNGAGRAIITVTAQFAGPSESASASYTLDVVLIDDGTYFLKNLDSVLYTDIQNNSVTSGNEIEQQKFDRNHFQEWIFTHIGNNVYTIKTAGSSTSTYYLGVENNSTAAGADIVLRTGTVSNGMKWKIE